MLYVIVFLLLISLLVVSAYLVSFKRQVASMASEMETIRPEKSNQLLRVESPDRTLIMLANAVNLQYSEIQQERSEQACQLNEIRKSMADISHDLRTPLTSIIGYLNLLKKHNSTQEDENRYVETAYDRALYLHKMINDLFELTRLESDAYNMEFEKVDVTSILANELASVYNVFEAEGHTLHVEMEESELPIIGDKQAISRVFSNLLQNMLRYGEDELKVAAKTSDGLVKVIFSNKATNVKEDDIQNIFKRSYTVDKSRNNKGTGLGLVITKQLVQKMDGEIHAELVEGRFYIKVCWRVA